VPGVRLRKQLLIAGTFLLIVLALAPYDPGSAGLVLFIGVLTPVMLWLLGLTRTPGFVRQARKLAQQRGSLPRQAHADVAQAEFRYPRKRGGQVVLWGLALFMAGLTVTVIIAGLRAPIALLVLGASAVLHAWLAYRIPRMVIRVGPNGMESLQLTGTVHMAWEDVLVLADSQFFYAYGGRMGGQTGVYSLHERLTIGDQLIGYAELLEIVRANVRPVELPPPQRRAAAS
jgi:hypothetical protein